MATAPSYASIDPAFAGLVDTARPPEVLASGLTWAEGPVWLDGALYFNDIPNRRMLRWQDGQGVSVALADSCFANGNTLDREGRMVSCVHGSRSVVRRAADDLAQVEDLATHWQGKRLNSPNDVVVSADGAVWFTDPPYGINSDVEGFAAASAIGANNVYRITPDGEVAAVATDFDKPNGLAFAPGEDLLYVADSGAVAGASFPGFQADRPHHVRVFDVVDGTLANGRLFVDINPGVPDGLRVDEAGDVWISAADGIQCHAPDGSLRGKVLLPEPTSNCCFGGPSGTDLFITSSSRVYRVRTSRRGAGHHGRGPGDAKP